MKRILLFFSKSNDSIGYDLKDVVNTKYFNVLKYSSYIAFLVYTIAQLILAFTFTGEQVSDSDYYIRLATHCAENGVWYPHESQIYTRYIFGNGLVNLVALLIRFTGSYRIMFFINILFTNMMLFSCLYIIIRVFNRITICYWFALFFCLLNTFWSEVVQIKTEVVFTGLAFFGLALLFSDKKYSYLLAGFIFALANWIRPLGIILIIVSLFIIIYRNEKIRNYLHIIASYAFILLIIGTISFYSCGFFVYQPETLGCNLIMTANDEADGSYMIVTGEGKAGYIPPEQAKGMTFRDYESYYKKISVEWILDNPWAYIRQTPAKLFYLFSTETYSGSSFYNNEKITSDLSYILEIKDLLLGNSDRTITFADLLIIFNQLWYMLIFALFLTSIVLAIKKKQWRSMVPFWLFFLGGTAITVIIVGGARYHFPYLPIMILGAAFVAEYIFAKKRKM